MLPMRQHTNSLRKEIAAFNRQCWTAAAGSLFLAWLAWMLAYGMVRGLVLLFATVSRGADVVAPPWINLAFLGASALLLILAGIDSWRRRFKPPPDRPILGWHLIADTLLLPARLTFAVGNHLDARIRLSSHEQSEAWRLLEAVADAGRVEVHELGRDFSDPPILRKSLDALQVLGWIDLHQGEDDWFYRLQSNREAELTAMRQGEGNASGDVPGEPIS